MTHEFKQVIIVQNGLKLPKGKLAAQCAHASVESAHKTAKDVYQAWRNTGQKKIVLKVDSEKELYRLLQHAKDQGISCALITDAGRTCIAPGTVTCLGIGPDTEQNVDAITGDLKML
ncbi:MAG: peptidyl-tRNA hydrolase Pth2 [Candidatus Woesearchaeota archaeon]